MSVDEKTANHTCNVIRRQIQDCIPSLHFAYIIHGENTRENAIIKSKSAIMDHPAGGHIIKYLQNADNKQLCHNNKSQFIGISRHHSPGFLGFLHTDETLALFFINRDRFSSKENLKNHALYLGWHAIALYEDYINNKDTKPSPKISHNVIVEALNKKDTSHRNLMSDIFSGLLQTLQGNQKAVDQLAQQRMHDTLTPTKGFAAESFPFPICLDTLDFFLENNEKFNKGSKKPVAQAIKSTKEIGKAYIIPSLYQWTDFSLRAQEMAWLGCSPKIILGTAIYTSENTYIQSIADIISERMEIKPQLISTTPQYNPFTRQEVNEALHKKNCKKILDKIILEIKKPDDYTLLLKEAARQNHEILTSHFLGWCAHALIMGARHLKDNNNSANFENTLVELKKILTKEIETLPWDVLLDFSRLIFQKRRDGIDTTLNNIAELADIKPDFKLIKLAINDPFIAENEKSFGKQHRSFNIPT